MAVGVGCWRICFESQLIDFPRYLIEFKEFFKPTPWGKTYGNPSDFDH